MAEVYIIAMGAGGRELVTPQAWEYIQKSDILIGSPRFAGLYPELQMLIPESIVEGTISVIKDNHDKNIGVMVTGDAGFYSLARSVVKEFGKERVTVVPGVGIVQAAFAKICEPWEDAVFISLHGRGAADTDIIHDRFLILCDTKNNAKNTVSRLISLLDTHDIYVFENLTMHNEQILHILDVSDMEKIRNVSLSAVAGIRR
jgi:cobalt-precorrin-7 (C5)-methyltransferase